MAQSNMLAMILAGGRGSRLHDLTTKVAKPAVSYGGKYRIIDFPLSNCANSGIDVVGILTQYESVLLNSYVSQSGRWGLDARDSGVFVLPPREKADAALDVYRGTADAISQNIDFVDKYDPEYILILSGDHIYKMNYDKMLAYHKEMKADATIAVLPVPMKEASRFGIMNTNETGRIVEFEEKPPVPKSNLASMGIYIFDAPVIEGLLQESDSTDFGKEIIPDAIGKCHTHAYIFDGYWEDIGTIRSFYDCNIALTEFKPAFNFYDEDQPIFTHMRNLPPSKINRATIEQSLTSEGCIISDCKLTKSVIGVRSIIEKGSELEGVIMMGSDFYENKEARDLNDKQGIPHVGIGKNCKIRETIIDKDAHIGNNVRINVDGKKYEDGDHGTFYSADGIIVIRKGAVIPDGTVI